MAKYEYRIRWQWPGGARWQQRIVGQLAAANRRFDQLTQAGYEVEMDRREVRFWELVTISPERRQFMERMLARRRAAS